MDSLRFNGARAFVDATHAVPTRTAVDTAAAPVHLSSTGAENATSVRRLKSDATRRRPVVVTAVDSDLKKLSKRRSKGRQATVEAIDPDVNSEGLLGESLYSHLEAAYRRPSFATLMSDFEARLGNSTLTDEDINLAFGLKLQSKSDPDASLAQESLVHTQVAAEAKLGHPICKDEDIETRAAVEGNSILKDEDIDTQVAAEAKLGHSISKDEDTDAQVAAEAKLGNPVFKDEDIDTRVAAEDKLGNLTSNNSDTDIAVDSSNDVSKSDSRYTPVENSPLGSASSTSSRISTDNGDVASASTSSPKAVKRRRGRGRGRSSVEGNRILKITKNPVTRVPRKLVQQQESDVTVVSDDVPVEEERGGKRRLSLSSRIAMKQSKQSDSRFVGGHAKSLSPEDQNLWSEETDALVNTYSTSFKLTVPLWDKLDRGLLTAAEENRLAMYMKPMKKLEKMQKVLMKQLEKEPTDEEWASAAGVDLSILRRRLALGGAARMKLIQRNLRLVMSQAFKYYKESMSLSVQDLCQEGVMGLMQAVDKFDPSKGYRFSTYGIYWIRNSILRAQTKSGHMLRSPHNVSTHRVNIKRAKVDLGVELGRPPTNEEIQKHLGITADRFRDILRTNMRTSSIHEHDRVTGREKVENLISDNDDGLFAYGRGPSMVQNGLDDVLDSLRPKENLVLRQRYGLDGKGQRSLSEVGLILNLSREMVRRHELRGILKLQHPTRVEYLRNYLN